MKTRVVYMIDSLCLGGAQRVMVNLCKFINKTKYDVHVISWRPGFFEEKLKTIPGVTVHNINLYPEPNANKLSKAIMAIQHVLRINRILKQVKPDVLQTVLLMSETYGAIMKVFHPNIKIVCKKSNVFPRSKMIGLYYYILSLAQSKIICVSKAVMRQRIKDEHQKQNKITVIHNSVDLKEYEKSIRNNRKTIHLIYFGRFDINIKGLDTILDALQKIEKDHPGKVKMFFMGGRADEKQLKQLCKEQIKNYEFLESTHNISKALKNMDIVVAPSRWEAFGMHILEGMACGLPAIATKTGGIPELLSDKENGLLIPPNNPEALYEAIKYFIQNPNKIDQMGEVATSIAKTFDASITAKKFEKVYEEVLQND